MSEVEYAAISINEDFYEQAIIEYFTTNLGYEYLHGPDIERTSEKYDDVFLPNVLPVALKRINPHVPSQAIEEAIRKISTVDSGKLESRNEQFHEF